MTDQKLTLRILKLETGDLEMNPFHFKASVSNFSIPVQLAQNHCQQILN